MRRHAGSRSATAMMSARKASPIDGSRAIASWKVCRISAAGRSRWSSRDATRWATELSRVSWFRMFVSRNVASSGSRPIASSASCRMRANSGSFPASPTIRAVKPCMTNSWAREARYCGIYSSTATTSRPSVLDDRHRPRPAGGGALDLGREARDHESGRRQRLEIVQLLDVAVADAPAGLVALPDDRGVARFGVALGGVDKRRVPAPRVGAGHPHALAQKVEGRLGPHAAAGRDIVRAAVFRPGARVDDDDVERRQLVPDALELGLDVGGGRDIAVGEMAEVELDAALETPFERDLVDRPGALALVHRRVIVPRRVEMRAVVGRKLHA